MTLRWSISDKANSFNTLIPAHHTEEATCYQVWAKTMAALHQVELNKSPPQTGFCDIKLFFFVTDALAKEAIC
jgi:hypothetical protein